MAGENLAAERRSCLVDDGGQCPWGWPAQWMTERILVPKIPWRQPRSSRCVRSSGIGFISWTAGQPRRAAFVDFQKGTTPAFFQRYCAVGMPSYIAVHCAFRTGRAQYLVPCGRPVTDEIRARHFRESCEISSSLAIYRFPRRHMRRRAFGVEPPDWSSAQ